MGKDNRARKAPRAKSRPKNPRTKAVREDQRVRLTKQMLQTAFLALLAEKPVQAISVKELCDAAGVNRSTFYLHYKDIYDLLEQMQGQMLAEIEHLLNENPVIAAATTPEATRLFIASIFSFFENNREMCAILLGPRGDKKFLADIIDMGREKSVREYLDLYPGLSREQAEIFYSFIAWGFVGLLQYGLADNDLPIQTLAASAEKIISEGTRFFEN